MPDMPAGLPQVTESTHADGLLAKTARGTGWVIVWRMATRFLGLANTLVLVRLLLPEDFGLVALGGSFVQAIDAFAILGVEDAVVRERAPTRDVYDTGFTMNLIRGAATSTLIAALAYPVAGFFAEPRLANILLALALGMLIEGFANIGVLDFRRDFAFEREFRFLLLPRILGIVVSIVLAAITRSYWSLIVGIIAARLFRVAVGYWMHQYRPTLTLRAWRRLVSYSLWSWAVSVAQLIRDRSDSILIGRLLNPTQVGIYTVGAEIAALPTTELVEPLCRAAFSSFSAARHAGVTAGEMYVRIVGSMALLTLPAGLGISLVADPLVKLAFGSLWGGAAPLVEVLGLAGAATVFGYVSSVVFSAHGLLRAMFKITLACVVLRVGLLIVFLPWFGLVGAAIAAATAIVFEQSIYVALTMRQFRVRLDALIRMVWRSGVATAVMAAVLAASGLGWVRVEGSSGALAQHLFRAVVAGATVYGCVLLATWLACGRPDGPELDMLRLGRRLIGRVPVPLRARRRGVSG